MDCPTSVAVDEEEEIIDKKLTDYGFEVQGLTFDEKKDLLIVLKNSETTALAEENSRVREQSVINISCSQSDINEKTVSEVDDTEITAIECISSVDTIASKHHTDTDNASNDSDDSNKLECMPSKETTSSRLKFTPKLRRLSLKVETGNVLNTEMEGSLSNNNSPRTKLSPVFDLKDTDQSAVHNGDDHRSTKSGTTLCKKEDRKRNIDVFNVVQDHEEPHFIVNKHRKIVGKTPYYVVPHGMNLKDFTIYFNEQLNEIAKTLCAAQRNSLMLVPWGKPVVAGSTECKKSPVEETDGQDDTVNALDSQRYNFRGRTSKRKCQDTIKYRFSDGDSSDEGIFIPKSVCKTHQSDKSHPYSGVSKRKPIIHSGDQQHGGSEHDESMDTVGESSNSTSWPMSADVITDDGKLLVNPNNKLKVKNICNSGLNKRTEVSELTSDMKEEVPMAADKHILEEKLLSEMKNQTPNSRQQQAVKRKKVTKAATLDYKSTHHQDSDDDFEVKAKDSPSLWLNTSIDKQMETNVIKPMPINPKMRKLCNSSLRARKKQGTPTVEEVDELIETSDNEESEVFVEVVASKTPCPICKQLFPISDIQVHASDCDGYQDSEISTTNCPNCIGRFPSGPEFDKHAKNCQVKRRLVHPPVSGFTGRSRSKR